MGDKLVSSAERPWVLRASDISKYQSLECAILLDGRNMTSLGSFYSEVGRAFELPDYCSPNFNSLSEALSDLSWLKQSCYLALITNGADVLSHEGESVLSGFIELLNEVGEEWGSPVIQGESWDRPAIVFKVIFETNGTNERLPLISLNAV